MDAASFSLNLEAASSLDVPPVTSSAPVSVGSRRVLGKVKREASVHTYQLHYE